MKKLVLTILLGLNCLPVMASNDGNYFQQNQRNMGPVPDLRDWRQEQQNPNEQDPMFIDQIADAAISMGESAINTFVSWFAILPVARTEQAEMVAALARPEISLETLNAQSYAALTSQQKDDSIAAEKILKSPIDEEDLCYRILTYLNKSKDVRKLDISESRPPVIISIIKFMNDEANHFKDLRILLCQGHNLTSQQANDLLKVMAAKGNDYTFLDLTPGIECDQIVLVGLAAYHTRINPHLHVLLSNTTLPEGYQSLNFPKNLELKNCRAIQSDNAERALKIIKGIQGGERVGFKNSAGEITPIVN